MTGMTSRRTYAACKKSWRDRTSRRMCPSIRLPAPVIRVRKAIRRGVSGDRGSLPTTSATSTGTMPSGSRTVARMIVPGLPKMPDTCRRSWRGTVSLQMYPSIISRLSGPTRIQRTRMAPEPGKEGFRLTTSVSSTNNTQIGWKTRAATTATTLTRTRAACRTSWRGTTFLPMFLTTGSRHPMPVASTRTPLTPEVHPHAPPFFFAIRQNVDRDGSALNRILALLLLTNAVAVGQTLHETTQWMRPTFRNGDKDAREGFVADGLQLRNTGH